MMYLILFVGLVLGMIYDLTKTKVNATEDADVVTVEIKNASDINIVLD